MNRPRFQSTTVPGLVMWPNGAIVRVALDEKTGAIKRDGHTLRPEVLASYGRVDLPGLERDVFALVEALVSEAQR